MLNFKIIEILKFEFHNPIFLDVYDKFSYLAYFNHMIQRIKIAFIFVIKFEFKKGS